MIGDVGLSAVKEFADLTLREPDGLVLHADFEPHGLIRLVDDNLVFIHVANYIRFFDHGASGNRDFVDLQAAHRLLQQTLP